MSITLEYPTAGASETFLLLNPKSQEEYNPISEVVRIITVVLTRQPLSLFATLRLTAHTAC
jgi:hypothetical protein